MSYDLPVFSGCLYKGEPRCCKRYNGVSSLWCWLCPPPVLFSQQSGRMSQTAAQTGHWSVSSWKMIQRHWHMASFLSMTKPWGLHRRIDMCAYLTSLSTWIKTVDLPRCCRLVRIILPREKRLTSFPTVLLVRDN